MFTLLIFNALIGVILLEWALFKTRRIRVKDEERDSRFPAWRRHGLDRMTRLRLYPGAITIMPLKWTVFRSWWREPQIGPAAPGEKELNDP